MAPVLQPLHLLAVILAGWSNRHQQRVIEYLLEENRTFKHQMRKRKLRLTDTQRARLAVKGKALGRGVLNEVANIVTPDTIMRWHRRLIALKWTYKRSKPGRPGVMRHITELTLRMARDNSSWGYDKIEGALKNLGHRVAPSTIANILRRHGIEPAPERRTSWKTFLRAHWESIAATDFFTAEVWTPRGLKTYYVLFFMELSTRKVTIAGVTPHPHGRFMSQVARNLTDEFDGFLHGKRFLIHDRDTKFSKDFKRILGEAGVKSVQCPARAPNCKDYAYAERFVRTIKEECLSRMIFFGEASLRRALHDFTQHYHRERNHQGLDNQLIEPDSAPCRTSGAVRCRQRLGGMLRFYHRQVA